MAGEKKNYLWKLVNQNDMVFWTKTCSTIYLSEPPVLMPKSLVESGSGGKIISPPKLGSDPLGMKGIGAGGFASKSRGYYQTIGRHSYGSFILIVGGELSVRDGARSALLTDKDMLFIPSNKTCDISVKRTSVRIIWFHLSAQWQHFMSRFTETVWKKFRRSAVLKALAAAYRDEVYSQEADASILEHCADAIAETLRAEFTDIGALKPHSDDARIEKLLLDAEKSGRKITAQTAAATLGMTTAELDAVSLRTRGISFSKLAMKARMQESMRLLRSEGASCAEVSEYVGYASQFAFSRAFKAYFGAPPERFRTCAQSHKTAQTFRRCSH